MVKNSLSCVQNKKPRENSGDQSQMETRRRRGEAPVPLRAKANACGGAGAHSRSLWAPNEIGPRYRQRPRENRSERDGRDVERAASCEGVNAIISKGRLCYLALPVIAYNRAECLKCLLSDQIDRDAELGPQARILPDWSHCPTPQKLRNESIRQFSV